jgi:hypothetical protein
MGMRCLRIALCLLGISYSSLEAAPPKTPPLDADKLAPGVFTGTLVSTPDADRLFTLNVTYQKLQLKPGQNLGRTNGNLQRQYNRIVQLQNQMMNPGRRHNPVAVMQQLQNALAQFQIQMAQAEANLFQVVTATQKVDFHAEENVKVRTKELPEQIDDKGETKKYTKEELSQLKGKDKNLPGYESSLDALKIGQPVQVTLGVHKKPRPTSSADKDKDKDKDTSNEHKMQVKMIVILKDGDTPPSSTQPGAKPKK